MSKTEQGRCRTGIAGLDDILRGGLPRNRLYLVQGEPGTGKTTLALQYLLEGARQGEKGLYITFSETEEELNTVAASHGWDLKDISLFELSSLEERLQPESQNTVFHPSEVEMNQTTALLLAEVERVKPTRVVFDSVSEMRMLAETPLKYRRQMLSLKQFFSGRNCTVMVLDDRTAAPSDLQVQSIVHGVINLQKMHPEFGDERRRLNIVKVRGIKFTGGHHDYTIRTGGIEVFPRMISAQHFTEFNKERISSGIPRIDALLGGGLDAGTSTLFLGPAGTGKSTLSILYAVAAAQRGEYAMIFAFEESIHTLLARTAALGMDLKKYLAEGLLEVRKIDPAELSPGEFADSVRSSVLAKKPRVIVIDSLNGYLQAMPQEQFLILQLHELLAFLGNQGVATILVLAQQGLPGAAMIAPMDVTYLADTVVIIRFFEAAGAVKKAVSVMKKRGGSHETTIREFAIGKNGITVGEPLSEFQGVLTGIPSFHGKQQKILEKENGSRGRAKRSKS
ncbi:MAG TPA: ATPase domain-containing protein [Bdellovibrionota bacterium]|nr:ATPase domain-containing protein [Bdellovibrionota bacterium]